MISFQHVTLRIASRILIQGLNWTIHPKQKIGLIGANGSGKTTLFSTILGSMDVDTGELSVAQNLTIAHVAQETVSSNETALEFVLAGDAELCQIEAQLQQAEHDDDGMKLGSLHEKMQQIDAYSARSRAAQLLDGLGFSHEKQQFAVSEFSGGWRMRLNLAKALMCRSDMLLLDEPTNHLDLDAILWLENWIKHYQGTLLLISHDRDFLDKTVTEIAHLEHQQLKIYTGNYSQFEKQRVLDLRLQQAAFEKQQKHVAHMQSYVDRFRYKASKAKQAQSRMKAIEKMEMIAAVGRDASFNFSFKEVGRCPDPLLVLEDLTIGYDNRVIISKLNLTLRPKERLAILGPNGAGKSTLIKAIAGELEVMNGLRTVSGNTKIAYFAQHQIDHLELTETPFTHLQAIAKSSSESVIRSFLGSFGFSGERIDQQVADFSGGEKSRLALALIVWQQPNLLLLDEPTNHLDLDMRQALTIALQSFQGAMILISHDRFLLNANSDVLYLLADGRLTLFEGDLADYEKWLLDYRRQAGKESEAKSTVNDKKSDRQRKAKEREARQPLEKKISQLEKKIAKHNQSLAKVESSLADNTIYLDERKVDLQKLLLEQADLKKAVNDLEQEWILASEQLALFE